MAQNVQSLGSTVHGGVLKLDQHSLLVSVCVCARAVAR